MAERKTRVEMAVIGDRSVFSNVLSFFFFFTSYYLGNQDALIINGIFYLTYIFSLRNNSHTIKFTAFKCTIQWVLVFSQRGITITTVIPEHFHHPPRNNPYPLALFPHFPPLQPLTTTNVLSVCTGKCSDIMCGLTSGFFCLASCFQGSSVCRESIFHYFLWWTNNIPLCEYTTFSLSIYQMMDSGLFPLFGYYK